jgi:hypothetical protein
VDPYVVTGAVEVDSECEVVTTLAVAVKLEVADFNGAVRALQLDECLGRSLANNADDLRVGQCRAALEPDAATDVVESDVLESDVVAGAGDLNGVAEVPKLDVAEDQVVRLHVEAALAGVAAVRLVLAGVRPDTVRQQDCLQRRQVVAHALDHDFAGRGRSVGVDRVNRTVVQSVRTGIVASQVARLLHRHRIVAAIGNDEDAGRTAAGDRRCDLGVMLLIGPACESDEPSP